MQKHLYSKIKHRYSAERLNIKIIGENYEKNISSTTNSRAFNSMWKRK